MRLDIYYGIVLKICWDFDIILVNNFIDWVIVIGNFLFGCCSYIFLYCFVNIDCNINWFFGNKKNC